MRAQQTVLNMVAATVVVMLGVGAVYLTTLRTESDQVTTVDFDSQLSIARAQATSYTPVRPGESAKWSIVSAEFFREGGVERWRVGLQLTSGSFVWIEQVDGEIEQALERWSRDGERVGAVDVLGVPREKWESGSWRALTFSDEGVALALFGKATFAELSEVGQSLSGD
jgi:hypothetical protein